MSEDKRLVPVLGAIASHLAVLASATTSDEDYVMDSFEHLDEIMALCPVCGYGPSEASFHDECL